MDKTITANQFRQLILKTPIAPRASHHRTGRACCSRGPSAHCAHTHLSQFVASVPMVEACALCLRQSRAGSSRDAAEVGYGKGVRLWERQTNARSIAFAVRRTRTIDSVEYVFQMSIFSCSGATVQRYGGCSRCDARIFGFPDLCSQEVVRNQIPPTRGFYKRIKTVVS